MPELPEVESFRLILLPLVDETRRQTLSLLCPPPLPENLINKGRFPSKATVDRLNKGAYSITDVLRKGKVVCVVLRKTDIKKSRHFVSKSKKTREEGGDDDSSITGEEQVLYLSLHFGMTGRMSSPDHMPELMELKKDSAYPPPHTHLVFAQGGKEASFSDPRRFGSVLIHAGPETGEIDEESIPTFADISKDALSASEEHLKSKSARPARECDDGSLVDKLMNRKKGIKGLLLDQRAVVSGVGNWVADEILYRSKIHPDQAYLTKDEAEGIVHEMHSVLSEAVECLKRGNDFPKQWLFHYRWRLGGSGSTSKDHHGKTIHFVQSGGRSSAIIPSLQKVKSRSRSAKKPAKAGKKREAAESKRSVSKKVKVERSRELKTETKSRDTEAKTTAVRRSARLSKSQ
mmetsp:Transcript_4636/g.9718  ORF Transcript_4636/g.9718 Transcript_4636/m.9718 type:complete len:403 (+) Transcript_4636:44-1252(+)